ncbi:MAG: hypothetical protein WD995_02115 [Gemmatimonadota bacterium]
MFYRNMLVAALVAAPMVLMPADASAQQRGADRAQVARGAAPGAPASPGSEVGHRAQPEGLKKAFEGRTPPAALQRLFPGLFSQPAPEPAVEPEPAPEPAPAPEEDCETSIVMVDGAFVLMDCEGNIADPSALE